VERAVAANVTPGPYAEPREIAGLADCDFYHTMELPKYGLVQGEWDLRGKERDYLGGLEVQGKRVLDVGAASGHVSFFMERAGAEVVSFDLSPEQHVDAVPYARADLPALQQRLTTHIGRLNNGYWLAHRALGSQARMAYGSAYDPPAGLGTFDVTTLGCVLLHLRDPFLALQRTLALTSETVVVVEPGVSPWQARGLRLGGRLGRGMFFRPEFRAGEPPLTWWRLTPSVVRLMIAVLGFEESELTFHKQLFNGTPRWLFTVVGRRTVQAG
jgi:SAM-dependent methyltransferase